MRFYVILPFIIGLLQAQSIAVGAKQSAMAGTSLTSFDAFAASNSIGATPLLEGSQMGLFLQNHYLFAHINTLNFSAVQMIRSGAFTYQLDYFGYTQFNTMSAGLGYAHKLGDYVGLGLGFNYHRIAIEGIGAKNAMSFDLGFLYKFKEKLRFAISIRNPIKQKLEAYYKETLATNFLFGASFHPNEHLSLTWEIQKDLQLPIRIAMGIDYAIHPVISLRMGVSIYPILIGGGIGIHLKSLDIDLASTWDSNLAYSPQISLSYVFHRKN